ncbi:asparaginase [Tepidimonas charontis]|uniref:asparaginase n=1 Tax=Tepidimonas charontis TaxID=2267262 RepID=A0A554XEM3_9BURK|nr:asparaginase [Tepidimonas charontis]TSE34276.1 L-asparaginase 1 [Tepidimonas charontis]
MARVLMLAYGGTIGMVPSPHGYVPAPGLGERLRRALQDTGAGAALPAFEVWEQPPIDSANLRPHHWQTMAQHLQAHWADYDGFVVLHGTDTMAWSAAALAFLLRGLDKPVILTGAQIPLGVARSDALSNVSAALMLAAQPELCEVALCFGRFLWRGCRARKVSAQRFDAFAAPNDAPLAELGIELVLHRQRLWRWPHGPRWTAPAFDDEAVAVLTLHPGVGAAAVRALTASERVRALLLLTYGAGNVPAQDTAFLDAIAAASAGGVVVVNATQCWHGAVDAGAYATGSALARLGVVPLADMTPEAAWAKLHVLLASGADTATIRAELVRNWCGELGANGTEAPPAA